MYATLLQHYWKSLFRRTVWTGVNLSLNAVSALLGVYVILHCLAFGLFVDIIIEKLYPDVEMMAVANENLLAGFALLFFLRFFLQTFPHVRTRPYLQLPVSRAGLVHFFQVLTLFNFHNIYPLFFFVPFWLKNVAMIYPAGPALAWMGGVLLLLAGSNCLVIGLRVLIGQKLIWGVAAFGGVAGAMALDKVLGWHYIDALSAHLFNGLLGAYSGLLLLALVGPVAGLYAGVFTALSKSIFIDALGEKRGRAADTVDGRLAFLERYGLIGKLILLEIKMIWRKKRTRQVLFSTIIFIPLGFMYSLMPTYEGNYFTSSLGFLVLTGALVLNYGQFMFSWESRYFDGTLARGIDFRTMVRAKLAFLQVSCLVLFLLTAPVIAIFAWDRFALFVAFTFFNAGFCTMLYLLLATMNVKRMNLSQSSFANWNGMSIHHFIVIVPLVALPILIQYLVDDVLVSALVIGGIGFASGLARRPWVHFLAESLATRKYRMAAGFRGKN